MIVTIILSCNNDYYNNYIIAVTFIIQFFYYHHLLLLIGLSMPQMLFSINQCAEPHTHWYQSRPPADYWSEYEEIMQSAQG